MRRSNKPDKPFILTPTNGTGPFPVALWLHEYRGYSAEGYFPGETAAAMQKHADTLGAVIIGFPATTDPPASSDVQKQNLNFKPVSDMVAMRYAQAPGSKGGSGPGFNSFV